MRTSFRAFAPTVGASEAAIRKAVRSGRLSSRSIGRDKRGPYIRDTAVARQEWEANRSKPQRAGEGASALPPLSKREAEELLVAAVAFLLAMHVPEAVRTRDPDGTPDEFDSRRLLEWLRGDRATRKQGATT